LFKIPAVETDLELELYYEKYGIIYTCEIKRNEQGNLTGYGLVQYISSNSAKKLIEEDPMNFVEYKTKPERDE